MGLEVLQIEEDMFRFCAIKNCTGICGDYGLWGCMEY